MLLPLACGSVGAGKRPVPRPASSHRLPAPQAGGRGRVLVRLQDLPHRAARAGGRRGLGPGVQALAWCWLGLTGRRAGVWGGRSPEQTRCLGSLVAGAAAAAGAWCYEQRLPSVPAADTLPPPLCPRSCPKCRCWGQRRRRCRATSSCRRCSSLTCNYPGTRCALGGAARRATARVAACCTVDAAALLSPAWRSPPLAPARHPPHVCAGHAVWHQRRPGMLPYLLLCAARGLGAGPGGWAGAEGGCVGARWTRGRAEGWGRCPRRQGLAGTPAPHPARSLPRSWRAARPAPPRWATPRRWRCCSALCTTGASLTAAPRATASSSCPASSTWTSWRPRA